MLRWQAKAAKARLTDNTTGPDSIRPKEEKWKKRLGGGDFDEGVVVIYLLLENSKGSGTVETIYKEHKIGGGSVMPLCGIMLPPSKNQRESANMMLFADTTAARTRITPLVLSCLPFTILVLNNNEIKINPSMNKLLSRLAYCSNTMTI